MYVHTHIHVHTHTHTHTRREKRANDKVNGGKMLAESGQEYGRHL